MVFRARLICSSSSAVIISKRPNPKSSSLSSPSWSDMMTEVVGVGGGFANFTNFPAPNPSSRTQSFLFCNSSLSRFNRLVCSVCDESFLEALNSTLCVLLKLRCLPYNFKFFTPKFSPPNPSFSDSPLLELDSLPGIIPCISILQNIVLNI